MLVWTKNVNFLFFTEKFIESMLIYCPFLQTNTTLNHSEDSIAEFPTLHSPTWLSWTWYARLGLTNHNLSYNHNLFHYTLMIIFPFPTLRLECSSSLTVYKLSSCVSYNTRFCTLRWKDRQVAFELDRFDITT